MTSLLLTYFGPFEGVPQNPTGPLAQKLARALAHSAPEVTVHLRELPVEYEASGQLLRGLLAELEPQLAICLGVALGRQKVSLEEVARNLDSAPIPDNSGSYRSGQPIDPQGPPTYRSSLPLGALFEHFQAQGQPVEISQSAGSYVCNHVFYELMQATAGSIPAGFIHLPMLRDDSGSQGLEATAGSQLRAYTQTGGLELGEKEKMPTLPLGQVVGICEELILLTLKSELRDQGLELRD